MGYKRCCYCLIHKPSRFDIIPSGVGGGRIHETSRYRTSRHDGLTTDRVRAIDVAAHMGRLF
jgi:hypothetical protein